MHIETIEVSGFRGAVRALREPMESWDKSDSSIEVISSTPTVHIGSDDIDLFHRLLSTRTDADSKVLRMIHVQAEITAPAYFIAELATYKVGTTMSSSSIQHTGAKDEYILNDFEIDKPINEEEQKQFNELLNIINTLRRKYKDTNDYEYFRKMRQIIPQSYLYTVVYDCNYQTLRNMYKQRILDKHRLKEWSEIFYTWMRTLPYFNEIITYNADIKGNAKYNDKIYTNMNVQHNGEPANRNNRVYSDKVACNDQLKCDTKAIDNFNTNMDSEHQKAFVQAAVNPNPYISNKIAIIEKE